LLKRGLFRWKKEEPERKFVVKKKFVLIVLLERKIRKPLKSKVRRKRVNKIYFRGTKRFKIKGRISPLFKKCKCGKRITHHHFLCNRCWEKKLTRKA